MKNVDFAKIAHYKNIPIAKKIVCKIIDLLLLLSI